MKVRKICYMCKQESSPDKSTKIYTRKELVMMEITISDFHTSFYIPDIQKLAFHLPHVHILGTNNCDEIFNSRVPKTVRYGTSLHRICPKLLIDSSTSRLESIESSPSWLESQTSVRRPTEKLFGLSPIRLESQVSVRQPTLKLIGSSHSRLDSSATVDGWTLRNRVDYDSSRLVSASVDGQTPGTWVQ